MVQGAVTLLGGLSDSYLTVENVARHTGIAPELALTAFPTDRHLSEAVGAHGVIRLSDHLTRQLVRVPPGDGRAALIVMGTSLVEWAQANARVFGIFAGLSLLPSDTQDSYALYDRSFVPLVRRFLGEAGSAPSYRALHARAFIFGLAVMALDRHLPIWMDGDDPRQGLERAMTDFVDMLLGHDSPPMTGAA